MMGSRQRHLGLQACSMRMLLSRVSATVLVLVTLSTSTLALPQSLCRELSGQYSHCNRPSSLHIKDHNLRRLVEAWQIRRILDQGAAAPGSAPAGFKDSSSAPSSQSPPPSETPSASSAADQTAAATGDPAAVTTTPPIVLTTTAPVDAGTVSGVPAGEVRHVPL